LWRYAITPILMNMVITGLVIAAFISVGAALASYVHPWFAGGTGWSGWAWIGLEIVVWLLVGAATIFATILLWRILTGVFCGYAYGKLAEEVERELGIPADQLQSIPFSAELVDTLLGVGVLLGANGVFLSFNLLPMIGSLLGAACSVWFNVFMLGADHFSYPLALRGQRRIRQYGFCRRNHSATMGIGSVVLGCQFLPIIGAFPVTASVIGCVLLHRRIEALAPNVTNTPNAVDT